MSISAVVALAQRLVAAYAFDAWPFALLHCVVLLYLARSILRVIRQTAELRAWQPTVEKAAGPAAVLSSFVRDSESLGRRGFVVPITDYSDRLDSEVENLVDEVADRTNMLLLVGIAGTLFGIFEFAWRAAAVTGDRLTQIGSLLSESMAKAFPVGFVGLMLMLVFQLSLAAPISALHRAASDATRRALEHRGVVSRTLAETIAESIADSMKPVSTLGETVSLHLQPLVAALGERLEQSLSLVKLQFGEIDQSTQRFIKATASLQQSANAVTNSSARLEDLFRAVPKVLARTQAIQELHETAMTGLTTALHRDLELVHAAAESLNRLQEGLSDLPEKFAAHAAAAISPAFERVAAQSTTTWQNLVHIVAVDIQRDYAEFAAGSRDAVEGLVVEMRALSDEMRRLAEGAQASMTEPLKTAIETARKEASAALAEVDVFVRERYPAMRKDMDAFSQAMGAAVHALKAVDERVRNMVSATPVPAPTAASVHAEPVAALRQLFEEWETERVPKAPSKPPLWDRFLRLLGLH